MIYVHNNSNFFTKLNTVLHTEPNDFETKLTAINQDYNSLKTAMNKKYENYKSKYIINKVMKKKKKNKFPLIRSHHEQSPSGEDNFTGHHKIEPIHETLSPKSKTFIHLFKNSITQNKRSIINYKQCIKEIEKEFYITGTNFNQKNYVRQGLIKKNKESLLIDCYSLNTEKDNEKKEEITDINNIALKINKIIQSKVPNDQLEAVKLEELKLKINIKKEKANKRLRVLKNAIKYLQLNGIKLDMYLEKNPFPPKPFYLPYSDEFILAAKFNKIDIIEEALDLNLGYLFEFDFFGQTAFHWAAKMGYVTLLQLLLKKGKCCNIYDKKMRTPLYLAALNNQADCCFILLKKNGSLDLCDNDGKRPYDVTTDMKLKVQLMEIMDKNQEQENTN